MPNSWCPSTNRFHSHAKGLLTWLIIWKGLVKVHQSLSLLPNSSFSSHLSALRGLSSHPYLFTRILLSTFLAKFCHICHFCQIRRVYLIRQLSGALLAKWFLFAWMILLTALAKFRQICHFAKICRFRHVSSSNFLGNSGQVISIYLNNFVNSFGEISSDLPLCKHLSFPSRSSAFWGHLRGQVIPIYLNNLVNSFSEISSYLSLCQNSSSLLVWQLSGALLAKWYLCTWIQQPWRSLFRFATFAKFVNF